MLDTSDPARILAADRNWRPSNLVAILDHIYRWETITQEEIMSAWREKCWKDLLAVHLHTMAHLRYKEAYNDLCQTWDQITNTPVQ